MDLSSLGTALPKARKVRVASDNELLDHIEEVIYDASLGAGLEEEELLDSVNSSLIPDYRAVTAQRIIKLINDNTGMDKIFLRFYSSHGPVALTKWVKDIILALEEVGYEDDNGVYTSDLTPLPSLTETIVDNREATGQPLDSREIVSQLRTIKSMVMAGYLGADDNMNVALTPNLVYRGNFLLEGYEEEGSSSAINHSDHFDYISQLDHFNQPSYYLGSKRSAVSEVTNDDNHRYYNGSKRVRLNSTGNGNNASSNRPQSTSPLRSPFSIFVLEQQAKIRAERPDLSQEQIAQLAASRWRDKVEQSKVNWYPAS